MCVFIHKTTIASNEIQAARRELIHTKTKKVRDVDDDADKNAICDLIVVESVEESNCHQRGRCCCFCHFDFSILDDNSFAGPGDQRQTMNVSQTEK